MKTDYAGKIVNVYISIYLWLAAIKKTLIFLKLLEVKLPYDPVCPSVGQLIGLSVDRSVS